MVKLVKKEPQVYEETRYDVFRDGVLLGYVASIREGSWQKHGRIRTRLIGRPKIWHAYKAGGAYHLRAVTRSSYTRKAAVQCLVAAVDEAGDPAP